MREKKEKIILTFHTTSESMRVEKIFKEYGIEGRLIPVPRKISAGCGIAWCSDIELKEKIMEVIEEKKIEMEGIHEFVM